MQEDLIKICEWAERIVMKFNESKFEQMTRRNVMDIEVEAYKTTSGK